MNSRFIACIVYMQTALFSIQLVPRLSLIILCMRIISKIKEARIVPWSIKCCTCNPGTHGQPGKERVCLILNHHAPNSECVALA